MCDLNRPLFRQRAIVANGRNTIQTAMHKLLIFKDEALLHQALTHRSYANENPEDTDHNERLEFLGDAILTYLSGDYLYRQYPDMGEDEMTRRRSALVDERQLALFATEVGIDFRMRLGQGVINQGGYQNPNLLSSTFEAVVGAYYLDSNRNIETLRPLVEALFEAVPQAIVAQRSSKDAKNLLQEFVQARGAKEPPLYIAKQIGGSDHAPEFVSRVYVDSRLYGEGRGRSKKAAEKAAASDALGRLLSK
jgi:ribonuclease III